MSRNLTPLKREILAGLIDLTSIRAVIEALSEICTEKAAYMGRDVVLAEIWRAVGDRVDRFADTLPPDVR